MYEQPEEILARLLTGVAEELDLPDDLHEGIVSEYTLLGEYLVEPGIGGTSEWHVYSQGSMRLGTVVLPTNGRDEFDIDLVCLRGLLKQSITQEELKSEVGDGIGGFVNLHRTRSEGPQGFKEGARCWTLLYPRRRFHMDTLPAIPDQDGSATAILLTDRGLRLWQHSDPIGYADWFRSQMEKQFLRERAIIAKAMRANVEDVPEWKVKTTMQRMVQVLKRHRDVHFANDAENRSPSILITTAAALTYRGDENLLDAVRRAADDMLSHFETRNGVIWLPNPVNDQENFADRWRTHPGCRQRFVGWVDQLRRDLDAAAGEKGLQRVAKSLQAGFGEHPVVKAAERLGSEYRGLRETGALTMTSTGILGTKGKTHVRDHDFYGASRRKAKP